MNTDKYIGKKYKHRGKGQSFDCLSLVISFLNDNGYNLPYDDNKPIEKNWYKDNPNRLIDGLSQYGKKVNDIQQFDIVVFAFNNTPMHCGVMTDRSHFMHVRQGKTVSISRLKHYRKYLHSIWRMEV